MFTPATATRSTRPGRTTFDLNLKIGVALPSFRRYTGNTCRLLASRSSPTDTTMKAQDAKKEKKKLPQKTAKEKKLAKAEKKKSR